MRADDPRHGTTRGFHAGCREMCCRRAIARYEKAGRLARLNGGRAVPALGAQRRLQALMALGWSSHRIATIAGLPHRNHVWRILNGQQGKPTVWIQRSTHAWVCRVYDELSMTVPTGRYVARTKAYAERMGYLPPLAWDDIDDPHERPRKGSDHRHNGDVDEVVVSRVLAGENLPTTRAEKDEIVRRWKARGGSERALCERMGWKSARYGKEDAA